MAKIIFLPLPEAGHIYPTFGLASQLTARGHEIGYMAPPDGEEFLRARSWPFTPILEDVLPKGLMAGLEARMGEPGLRLRERLNLISEFFSRGAARDAEVLFGSSFEARLRESRADLLIVDATFPMPILAAHKVKIPAVQICANLPLRRDLAVPPLTSDHIPTGTALSRLRIRLHWWSIHFGSGLLGARKLRAQVREFFRQHPDAVPGDFHAHLQLGPNLRIPTLVTCAPEFDFPRDSSEGLHYLGPCVDLSRPEAPLPAELPSGDAPLLVCSLGSHGDRVREHRAFFQAVIDAVARRPQWRLLMAVGSHLGAASFGTPPPNVVVVDKLPQLSALKRASLMITHGGLSSVKECICLGVPMLVYPLVYDQPGNAARVVHHGLGLRGNVRQASAEKIGAQIDEVAGNPAYRDRVRALQRVFLEADEAGRGAETVERLLRR